VIPDLAQKWTVSPDGKTYVFKLKPGVKWSDGVPLKAQDFVYSWKRLLSPSTGAAYAYLLFDIVGAEDFNKGTIKNFAEVGVKAPDDLTLEVKLAHAVAYWAYLPTFWVTFPLREDLVNKYKGAWTAPGKMVTTGPYVLAEYDHDSKVVLKANPNYSGTRGNIDEVVNLIVKDDSTALNLYESGRIDFLTDISTLDLKRLAGRQDLKAFPYFKTGYLGFVIDKGAVAHPELRRAIAMAIDKGKLGEILHGGQLPATSWVPPRMLAHTDNVGLPFDPERARAELAKSGLKPEDIHLEMVLPNWDKSATLAQFVMEELKKNLGISVGMQQFDHKTFRAQVDMRAFPLFLLTWTADYPDPDNFMSVYLGSAGNNRTDWVSEKYDSLVHGARVNQDKKSRELTYLAAQRLLLEDDAVIVPLYYEPNMALVKPQVQGLELNPLNYLLIRKVTLGS
jgi:oligopeptide transport system substrate-binding protein